MIDKSQITGAILAGGRARRLKGQDKGLLQLNRKPLIQYTVEALAGEVKTLFVSANRNQEKYSNFAPVISDELKDYQGPLAGIARTMQLTETDYLLIVPCDSPFIDKGLVDKLSAGISRQQADIAVAFDGQRLQPVFTLLKVSLLSSLLSFLDNGDRKIDLWYQMHKMIKVDFSEQKKYFTNLNSPEDFARLTDKNFKPPVLGFSAFSGVGKTSLITKIINRLDKQGVRIAVIKHAHHTFEIDKKGKDSYEIRKAGASQVLITSDNLTALVNEHTKVNRPSFNDLLAMLDTQNLDLILLEGFKSSEFNKIELQRTELGHRSLYKDDSHVIAVASNDPNLNDIDRVLLDLDNVDEMTNFVKSYIEYNSFADAGAI